jgi:hypothetical protein
MSPHLDNTASPNHKEEPTYWFAVLEIAREQGDFERAAEAKRQLRRLGVYVSYERLETPKGWAR